MKRRSDFEGFEGGAERDAAADERSSAAISYLLWPLAIGMLADVRSGPRSPWLVRHAKSAIILGASSWLLLFIIFAMPAILIGTGIVPFERTIVLFAWAFLVDIVVFVFLLLLALRCSRKAARGEAFTLASLLPIAKEDRVK